jgi:hypothetical protein
MASIITPTTIPDYASFYGDLDVFTPFNSDGGTGSIYLRSSTQNLYVGGVSNLFQTTITTSNGNFYVQGSNGMNVALTGTTAGTGITLGSVYNSTFNVSDGSLGLTSIGNSIGSVAVSADGPGTNSINIDATNTVSGQVHIQSQGAGTGTGAGVLIETTATGGQTSIASAGTGTSAVNINASAGGVNVNGNTGVNINTPSTTNGINIGTGVTGIPVTIGTSSSLTTIGGNLVVKGTTTTVNTTTLTFQNNAIILNSANNIAENNAGVEVRRYQIPSNTITGSVIANKSSAYTLGTFPIQENGVSQAGGTGGSGSPSPGVSQTIVLSPFAYSSSNVNDTYYRGWWIYIYASPASFSAPSIRRIKSYNGTTKTATIYGNSDNVGATSSSFTITSIPTGIANSTLTITLSSVPTTFVNGMVVNITNTNSTPSLNGDYIIAYTSGSTFTITTTVAITVAGTAGTVNVSPFADGLDWITAPPAGCSYYLYNSSYVSTFYNETTGFYDFYSIADGESGVTNSDIQQPQNIQSGSINIAGKSYDNVLAIVSGSNIILTIINHQLTTGSFVKLTKSNGFSAGPNITSGGTGNPYYVTVINNDQFSIPISGTVTPTVANVTSTSTSWSISGTNTLTLTTVSGTPFAVGMVISGTGIAASATIVSFTTGSGSSGTVAVISPAQSVSTTTTNVLTGYYGSSSVGTYFYGSSVLKTNIITSFDPEFPISIPGISTLQTILIAQTSTTPVLVTLTNTFGAYMLLVSDISGTGASSIFACSNNTLGSTPSRIVSSKGANGQRISAAWGASSSISIFHQPAYTGGSGSVFYTYQVRIVTCL